MHIDQAPYRRLHEALLAYDGSRAAEDLLGPWLRAHDDRSPYDDRHTEPRAPNRLNPREERWI